MKPVDYNTQQHENYVRGRSLRPDQVDFWIRAFVDRLPRRRPLHGLDLGSGTGRFTPALAAAFGPVTGVEPAVAMRRIAGAAAHPGVSYLSGSAEAIPLPRRVRRLHADVPGLAPRTGPGPRRRGARPGDPARRRRPAPVAVPRSHAPAVVARVLPARLRDRCGDVPAPRRCRGGLRRGRMAGGRFFGRQAEPSTATRAETLAKLRLRPYSIFEHFTPGEAAAGFERLEAAVAADPDALVPSYQQPLLTLTRR